jgi:hypothetical protein
MSTLPRDVRIEAIHEIGVKIDDALEVARFEAARREGAHGAYVNAARNIVEAFGNSSEDAKKCAAICSDLAAQTQNLLFASRGAERQAQGLVALIKQMHDLELAKKRRESEPLPTPPVVVAESPAPAVASALVAPPQQRRRTIKEERLAAVAAAEAAAAPKKPSARRK